MASVFAIGLPCSQEGVSKVHGCAPCQKINVIGYVAFLIIGAVRAAGLLPSSTVGWTAVGLGVSLFAFNAARGNLPKRRVELIAEAVFTAVIVIIGALGGLGILSAPQVGGGIIAVALTPKIIALIHCSQRPK